MNQILQIKEQYNKRNSNPIDTKKILLIFAFLIIVFGLFLSCEGAYNIYTQLSMNSTPKAKEPIKQESNIDIQFNQTDYNQLNVLISSDISISHIIYNWNSDSSITINESGKTNINEVIQIPSGDNVLFLSVIDSNGNETTKQESFSIEVSKPVIELSVLGNSLKVTVTSEAELSSVSYKWNSEEQQVEDMYTYENKNSFEKTFDIPKGQNTLKIIATDINGEITEKSQNIKGISKLKEPTVKVVDDYIEFTITAEDNIETVNFEFNGSPYIMNSSTFGETNTVFYKLKLAEGMNYLKIVVKSVTGAENTSVWKYDNTVQ